MQLNWDLMSWILKKVSASAGLLWISNWQPESNREQILCEIIEKENFDRYNLILSS